MPTTAQIDEAKIHALHKSGLSLVDIGLKTGLKTTEVAAILYPDPPRSPSTPVTRVGLRPDEVPPRTAQAIAEYAGVKLSDIQDTLRRAAAVPALPRLNGWRRKVVTWTADVTIPTIEAQLDCLRLRTIATTAGNVRCRVVEGQEIDLRTLADEDIDRGVQLPR